MDTSSKGSPVRNWLAAGVVVISAAVGGYLVGLDSRPVPAPQPQKPAFVPAPETETAQEAVLNRAGVIRIAEAEADRFGGGVTAPGSLAGRRFQIGIPFGCGGSSAADEPTGWTYDADSETLRIRVTPAKWTDAGWLSAEVAEGAVDAVEGFWLPRPWTSSEQCAGHEVKAETPMAKPVMAEPSAARPATANPDDSSTIALAHFFGSDSKRSDQRRGRPFEIVSKVEAEAVPTRGLQLLIEGRIANVPGGRSNALCHASSASLRPTCLVAVEFDRIAVVNPATQTELANWRL